MDTLKLGNVIKTEQQQTLELHDLSTYIDAYREWHKDELVELEDRITTLQPLVMISRQEVKDGTEHLNAARIAADLHNTKENVRAV